MNDKSMKKLFEESIQFIGMLYEKKVVCPNINEGVWFSNFGPPLSVMYYHYIRHYFNELSIDDIDDMCDVFADNVIPDTFHGKKQIVSRMKETNHNMDNMVSQIRSEDIPYDMALSSVLFIMFQQQPEHEDAFGIIADAAKKVSDYRTVLEDSVLRSKRTIIKFTKDLYNNIDNVYKFKMKICTYPEEYMKAALLFCMKYFGSHYCSPDMVFKYPQREYISQHFIKLIMKDLFKDSHSATMCYTMWNHLGKLFSPEKIEENKEKALLMIIVTVLMQIDKQAENESVLTMQVYHIIAEALNSYEFHF